MNTDIKTKINKYVDLFFEDVPYSIEVYNAKENIKQKLIEEYKNETTIDNMVNKYNSLTKLASLLGYSEEDVNRWKSKETIVSYDNLRRQFKKYRRESYFKLLLIILSIGLIYLTISNYRKLFLVLSIVSSLVTILFFFIKRKKPIKETYSIDSFTYLTNLHDKYGKKLLNSLFIGFTLLGFFLVFIFHLRINSKLVETIEYINKNSIYGAIIILLIGKNFLLHWWVEHKLKNKTTSLYFKKLIKVIITSIIYYVISFITCLIIGKYMINIVLIFCSIYLLGAFIYNISYRKNIMYKNIVVNKLKILLYIILILVFGVYEFMQREVWLIQPYINSVKNVYRGNDIIKYDDETGIYKIINPKGDFKILQLTDIHLGGSIISYDKDLKALEAVYKLIDYTRPDFVIVTGDLTFPMGIMSFSLNNYTPVMQFASFMRNAGIPWAFTYGNHDTESIATNTKADLNDLYKSLSWKTSRNLMYPYTQPNITGRNNQLIELRNGDGSLNQAIFLIDSNAYTGEGINKYDYIHDDQVEWYKNEVLRLSKEERKRISSLIFIHIPLQEYKEAYELYEKGSSEVEYYFGTVTENLMDKINCSEYPSKLFDTAVELKSTKGIFCGHDHYNNISLDYKGIRLTYGMSIDYLAMPGIAKHNKQRGATLITAHPDSSIDIEQIPLSKAKK